MTIFKVKDLMEFLHIAEPEELRGGFEMTKEFDGTLTIRMDDGR